MIGQDWPLLGLDHGESTTNISTRHLQLDGLEPLNTWEVDEPSVGPSRAASQKGSSTKAKADLEAICEKSNSNDPNETSIMTRHWVFTI